MKKRNIFLVISISIIISLSVFGFSVYQTYKVLENSTITQSTPTMLEADMEEADEIIVEIVEEPKISNIKLLAVGDIMFHSPQFKAAYNNESSTYDFIPTFKHVKKYIESSDIAIGNFETVTAGEEVGFSGFPRFNTPKESLLALKDTGFDILSTANNHSLDQGKKGIIKTIENIQEYGMKNVGTYIEEENSVLIEEVNDIKVGFLSYTYGLNGLDSFLTTEELQYMVNLIDEDRIKEDIEKAKNLEVDLIVVFIHWGSEYQREPSKQQIELGEKMVNWGANIVLGSHPHVIQRSQIINSMGRDNFIIYSLGNFLSNQRNETMGNPYTEDGIMLSLEIEKDLSSQETIIKSIEYIPTWVHKYWVEGKASYEILPIMDVINNNIDITLTDSQKSRIEKSFKDTMDKMTENTINSELN